MKQLLLTAALLSATSMMAQKLTYPQAPKDGTVDTYFGVKVADPYRPLENDSSKATAEWVAAENKVTQEYLSRIPFRGKLLKRMKELANYEKVSAPSYIKSIGKWLFSKTIHYVENTLVLQTIILVEKPFANRLNVRRR